MSTKRALTLAVLLLLGLVLAAVVAVLFLDFESPSLGDELLRRANAASGIDLSSRSFRLSLSRGAELRDVAARSRMPGVSYDLELATLRFQHAPLELLKGRLHVERAIAESPRVTIRVGSETGSRDPTPAPAPRPKAREILPEPEEAADSASDPHLFLDVALEVSELDIRNGAFLVQQTTDDVVRLLLDGVDLSLRGLEFDRNAVTLLHGVTASGRIAIRELRFASTLVERVEGQIALARGRLELEDLELVKEERRWAGRLSLDANALPFRYEIALHGGPFEALPFARSVDFSFDGRGFGVDSKNLTGSGTVSLAGGTIPESAWVRALEEASGRSTLVGASYGESDLSFRLEDDTLRFEPFTLTTEDAAMTVAGTISLEGELGLEVTLDDVLYRLRGEAESPTVIRSP